MVLAITAHAVCLYGAGACGQSSSVQFCNAGRNLVLWSCFMTEAAKSGLPDPFIFVPSQGRPQLLFVLLHGEAGTPQQLFPLADAIKSAFPLAMVVLPYAFQNIPADSSAGALGSQGIAGYHWVDPLGLNEGSYAERVGRSLPRLIEQISRLQTDYGLSGAQTALA